jgi:succinate-semialdehyde dehydrogenase / glutarate-semialdehyde dehydrogenase
VHIGPLTTSRQRDRIERLLADAGAKGARTAAGGKRPDGFNRGYFFEPTVIVEPGRDAAILTEEPFGPTAIVQSFADDEEAVRMANSVDYGLAAYIYTPDAGRSDRIASGLESGVIGVNTNAVAIPEGPFGGVKHSGFGREGGFEGVQEYLVQKFVHRA